MRRRPRAVAEATELGLALIGVPEELGGAMSERSAVTGVLVAEALAHGDLGLAVAILAPAGVATALALWGDADQQATYLPAFTGDEVAPRGRRASSSAARSSTRSQLETTAARNGDDWVLDGVKALVPLRRRRRTC